MPRPATPWFGSDRPATWSWISFPSAIRPNSFRSIRAYSTALREQRNQRLVQLRRAGHNQVAFGQAVDGQEVVGPASCFAHEEDSGQRVPSVDMQLQITIVDAAGDVREAERTR